MALTDNQQAYYKLDEVGTGNAADSSGNGYTLTNNGPATYATGKINNGWDGGSSNSTKFEGIPSSSIGMDMSTSFTYNWWINVTTQPGSGAVATPIWWEDETTANKKGMVQFQLFNNSGTMECYILRQDSNGADQIGTAQTFTPGTWYMLTYTWDGSNQKLYSNGSGSTLLSQASTRTGTNSNVTGSGTFFIIGADNVNSRYLSGLLDEVGVWSRVLTGTEITTLYNGGNGLQYPFISGPANMKTFNGLATASVKTIDGLAIASVKTWNGLA